MGRKSAQRLRERFERDGYVELGLRPVKVATHLLFFVAMALGFPVLAWTAGGFWLVLAVVFVPWFVVSVGFVYAEQLLGAGPPLRIDRHGLTVRRWREPLVLPWSDVCVLFPYSRSRLTGPVVAILLPPWVWHDYRAARPPRLRWVDRLTHFRNRYLCLLKVLDVSATDILAFLDPETLDRLTRVEPPYRLVLDLGENGESPLCLRSGREAPLGDLPLRPATVAAVSDWNDRVLGLLDLDPSSSGFSRRLEESAEEARSLAVHLQADLGPGADVRFSGDVPTGPERRKPV